VDCEHLGTMHYVRVYADDQGETHFEDVAEELGEQRYSGGVWAMSARFAVDGLHFRRVDEEYPEEPHVAPRRQFIVHLAGEAEVEVSDGERRRFGAGSVLLLEDVTGKGHTTRRIGDTVRMTLLLPLDG
jgi:hypothetical protein